MMNAIAQAVNSRLVIGNYSVDDMVQIFCSLFVGHALDAHTTEPRAGLSYILETVKENVNSYALQSGMKLNMTFHLEADAIKVDDGVKH